MAAEKHSSGEAESHRPVSDLTLSQELVSADMRVLRADRDLAFARIAHSLLALGVKSLGDAAYFKFPLDVSRERRVVVAHTVGRMHEPIMYVWINDEVPHPIPQALNIRRLHMTSYVASMLGKRITWHMASADKAGGTGVWYANSEGPFKGPQIYHDKDLGQVELRGLDECIAPRLPKPMDVNSSITETYERTRQALRLADITGSINALHIIDASVVLPSAATLES